jgi:hypothetical protein
MPQSAPPDGAAYEDIPHKPPLWVAGCRPSSTAGGRCRLMPRSRPTKRGVRDDSDAALWASMRRRMSGLMVLPVWCERPD